MERVRSTKKPAPQDDPPPRAKPQPKGAEKEYGITGWSRLCPAFKLGSVPINFRSKPSTVMQETRRYYAGVIQIAYVEIWTNKIVLHVIDNPLIQSSHVMFRESDLQEKLTELLTSAEG